jgi:hypothetical protein
MMKDSIFIILLKNWKNNSVQSDMGSNQRNLVCSIKIRSSGDGA